MIYSIDIYIFLFFIYSFAGWFMESVGGILNVKKFVNRGFLIGPYCPVYGIGVVFVTILLRNYINDIPILFSLSLLICGTLEYMTSYFMEKFFNARWWDYHKNKFNINGRICLETLIPFSIVATLIICKINPVLIDKFIKIPENIRIIVSIIFSVLFIIDFIISFKIILNFKNEIRTKNVDNTDEITEKVKEKTDELGELVKDKTEDILLKASSDIILFGRKLRIKEQRFERQIKFSKRRLSNTVLSTESLRLIIEKKKETLNTKVSEGKEKISKQINQKRSEYELKQKEKKEIFYANVNKRKEEIQEFQKSSKQRIEDSLKNIKTYSDEITNKVIKEFRNKSLLSKRLMDAFPNLSIKEKNSEKDNKNK